MSSRLLVVALLAIAVLLGGLYVGQAKLLDSNQYIAEVAFAHALVKVKAAVPDLPNVFEKKTGPGAAPPPEERPLVECYWRGSRCRPCQQAEAKLAGLKPPFDVRTIVVGPNHPLPAGAFGPCYTIPVKEGGRIWVYRYANEQEDIVDKLMRIYRQRN